MQKPQPGIDVRSLTSQQTITLETADAVYEIEMRGNNHAYVSSTNKRLLRKQLGVIIGSSHDMAGKRMIDGWIGPGLFLHIQFQFECHVSTTIVSASVGGVSDGKRWHYEVFSDFTSEEKV